MTAVTKHEPSTAVAARVDSRVAELRERNALVAAIRGTQWGKDVSEQTTRAIAHYCNSNGLDPVRHVELLGGRIYLTASFYEERGAALLRSGQVRKAVPEFIHADERLDALAKQGDAWALEESTRRLRLRIQHGVPEAAKGACIQRMYVGGSDDAVTGVNWCGGTGRRDPVGDAEPTKTAETRAARRAWKQLAEVIPGYGDAIRTIEASARVASEEIPVEVVAKPEPVRALAAPTDDPYADAPRTSGVPVAPGSVNDHAEADRGPIDEDYGQAADGELALGAERAAPTPRRNAVAEGR